MGELKKMVKEEVPDKSDRNFYTGWYREGKYRIIIIFEDRSYKDYYMAVKDDYRFIISGKVYFLVPEAIINGKYSTLVYYYNNPMPIRFNYQYSKYKAIDNYTKEDMLELAKVDEAKYKELLNTTIDSRGFKILTDNKIIDEIYNKDGINFNWKYILIGLGFIIVICVILQITGVVDFGTFFTGGGAKK